MAMKWAKAEIYEYLKIRHGRIFHHPREVGRIDRKLSHVDVDSALSFKKERRDKVEDKRCRHKETAPYTC